MGIEKADSFKEGLVGTLGTVQRQHIRPAQALKLTGPQDPMKHVRLLRLTAPHQDKEHEQLLTGCRQTKDTCMQLAMVRLTLPSRSCHCLMAEVLEAP
mmetsp:Transcript_20634/g.57570  ORF Transcript_20634/g.57570 Transcript_20634/m.57570 type:complete len:98 (+) Transcript_20634:622-915(+)